MLKRGYNFCITVESKRTSSLSLSLQEKKKESSLNYEYCTFFRDRGDRACTWSFGFWSNWWWTVWFWLSKESVPEFIEDLLWWCTIPIVDWDRILPYCIENFHEWPHLDSPSELSKYRSFRINIYWPHFSTAVFSSFFKR